MKRFWLAARVLVFGFVGTAFAQPFQNGSFESDGPSCGSGYGIPLESTFITGWTVSAGNVDWASTGCNWNASAGTYSLDLVGDGSTGGVRQTFDTIPGAWYRVSFDLAGNPSALFPPTFKSVDVIVDGVAHPYGFETGANGLAGTPAKSPTDMGWLPHAFSFIAGGAASTLEFVSPAATFNVPLYCATNFPGNPSCGTFGGAALDNVRVTQLFAPGPTAWTGSAGTVTNTGQGGIPFPAPGSGGTPIGSSPTVVSDGTSAPAVFTYATVNSFCCHTGDWTFQTTANAAGDVIVDYAYAGYHGTCQAYAKLTAFVRRGAATSSTDVYFAQDSCNATPPSGGFDQQGGVTFAGLQPGDTYGFRMAASNYDGNGGVSGRLEVSAGTPPAPFIVVAPSVTASVAPVLIRAIAQPTSTYLIGRADVMGITPITINASVGSTCNAGTLGGASAVVGSPFSTTTDALGYFAITLPNVSSGNFVAVQQTAPSASAISACLASSGENDVWPKALDFGTFTERIDYIDAPGKARWYKFSITPGQKIQVTLTGSAADYDLVVFKDIFKAFKKQATPADATALTKLNAEFAPSTFSPSTFSPSTFSPSTFSPDAYSASALSPSTFSPSTFSPSTFSPSTFSPSTFSPSTFSPSTFSPSTFSPSTFSPAVPLPSTFSPASVFGIDVNTPAGLELVQQAFSSAQTRSIIGVSATLGTGNESVALNTWNETGDFYVRVAGRGDSFSTSGPFTLSVAKGPESCTNVFPIPATVPPFVRPPGPAGIMTVILTDGLKVDLAANVGGGTLLNKLQAFASRTDVKGAIVNLSSPTDPNYTRLNTLKAQAAANKNCPYATNLVAEEIKTIVDSYRVNNPGLRYVVIVGNDSVVPFFRYPDETLIGQESGYDPPVAPDTISDASLSRDFVLSQDAYGSSTRIAMRAIDFPVPGLAVGRLVETPAEIAGMIDAYTSASGVVVPRSSLVTGYDFLADAAARVVEQLQAGTGVASQTLITANGVSPQHATSWTATQLQSALFDSRHDVIFLAGHFSANSALAADFSTSLLTTELQASTTNFTNSIVFSAGCHAGYNIVDTDALQGVTVKLDWVQAFAQKRATLIAGTGYQYGDTDFVEYSERLYKNFARQLRAGTANSEISVGEALARAKIDYLSATPDIRGIHQKAVLEATLFGLPMLRVNMPAGREVNPVASGEITPALASGNAGSLGLYVKELYSPLSLAPAPTSWAMCLKNPPFSLGDPGVPPFSGTPEAPTCPPGYTTAQWLTGADEVVSNPAEPVLPLQIANVTPKAPPLLPVPVALRGVGFLGGSYTDSIIVPLTGAPTTELRGVHTSFSSPVFFPMRLWTTNYFGTLSGAGGTRLLVTPVQHRAADLPADLEKGKSVRRQFTGLDLRLYYSSNTTLAALSAAPTIVGVNAVTSGGAVKFTARVVGDPAAAVHDVWVTYTGGGPIGTWQKVDLKQCSATPPPACGTTTDTQLWMGDLSAPPVDTKYIVQAVNGVGLVSLDDNLGAYYSYAGGAAPPPPSVPIATTLALASPPQPWSITYGDTPAVTATLSSTSGPIASAPVSVSVGGTAKSGTTAAPTGQVTTNLAAVAPGTYQVVASYAGNTSYLPSSASALLMVNPAPSNLAVGPIAEVPSAILTASVGSQPLLPVTNELVMFAVTNGTLSKTLLVNTDVTGKATLPPTGLPIGTYSLAASFAGNALYSMSSLNLGPLQVTTPCPQGVKVKVRWHYSGNGSKGDWSNEKTTSCADGTVVISADGKEGDLKLAPGTTMKVGYGLQLPGNKSHLNAVITNAKVVLQASCVSGATPAAPGMLAVTIPNLTYSLEDKGWIPDEKKESPLTFQASGLVPDLCGGGLVRFNSGATFNAVIMLN